MYCKNCGNFVEENSKYCIKCGTAMIPEINNAKKRVRKKTDKKMQNTYLIVMRILVIVCIVGLLGLFFFWKQGDFRHLGRHNWSVATCTEPKTCTKCGMTQGDALGHEWKEATCEQSAICEECGETKGDSKGHAFTEADDNTRICKVCGEEETIVDEALTEKAAEEVAMQSEKGKMVLSEKNISLLEGAALYFWESSNSNDGYWSVGQLSDILQEDNSFLLFNYIDMFGGTHKYDSYVYFKNECSLKCVLYGALEEATHIYKELFDVDLQVEDMVQDEIGVSYDSCILYNSEYNELVMASSDVGFAYYTEYIDYFYDENAGLYKVMINVGSDFEHETTIFCFYLKENTNNSFGFEIVGAEWKTPAEELFAFLGEGASDITVPAYYEDGDEFYYEEMQDYASEYGGDMEEVWLDFDNDGEVELYFPNAYPCGGMILDARDGKVYVLAQGEGTAVWLSYTFWQGKYWIVHSDTSHHGRQIYCLTEYSGSNIVNEISLTAEYWENENGLYDENTDFTFAGEKITLEEFERLRMEMFGY